MFSNLNLVRATAIRSFLAKSPRDRAIAAQQLGAAIVESGIRDDIAAVAPGDITDAMDRLINALKDWRG